MNDCSIEIFNEEHAPFYIVDHKQGTYSLCYAIDCTCHPSKAIWQNAFNHYAEVNGEPSVQRGLYTHGNGYEWGDVFQKAFEDDPNLSQISFDCELGGFFCYAKDLNLLEDFGHRFFDICNDNKQFPQIVCDALTEASIREAAQIQHEIGL